MGGWSGPRLNVGRGTLRGHRDGVVTQIANRDGSWRERPRFGLEIAVSVIIGEFDVSESLRIAFRRSNIGPLDRVRHLDIGALNDAGYVVLATPTRSNPLHGEHPQPSTQRT